MLIFIFSFLIASAQEQCLDVFSTPQTLSLEASQVRPLTFDNVEVFRRNNNIGQQQNGKLRLEKWIEISPYSEDAYNFIGLTAEGRVYHVIDWHGSRRVARLLSGEKTFNDLFLIDNQVLAAIDNTGRISLYSPSRWGKSPRGKALRDGLMIWSGISFILTTGVYLFVPEATHWNFGPIPLPPAFISAVSALQTGFVMLNRYDHKNTFPDGFIKTQTVLSSDDKKEEAVLNLSPEELNQALLLDDLRLPERDDLPPTLPLSTTEDIR